MVWVMKVISIRLPDWMLDLIDKLCSKGVFISRSEFIRYAVRLALKRYEMELYDIRGPATRLQRAAYGIEEEYEE